MLSAFKQFLAAWFSSISGSSAVAKARQTGTIIQGVVVVVVASIGVVIVDNIDTSLGDPSSSALSSGQENLLDGFASMIDLIEPLLIVLIAVVVIAVVQRIRQ